MDIWQLARHSGDERQTRFRMGRILHLFLAAYALFWSIHIWSGGGAVTGPKLTTATTIVGLALAAAFLLARMRCNEFPRAISAVGYIFCIVGSVTVWWLVPGQVSSAAISAVILPPLVTSASYSSARVFGSVFATWSVAMTVFIHETNFTGFQVFSALILLAAPLGVTLYTLRRIHRYCITKMALLSYLANQDPLTGVLNRRGLHSRFSAWRESVDRPNLTSVVLLDVDHFKRVNDTLGHQAGDLILQKIAETVKQHVEPGDLISRSGGEEFALITSRDGATVAEELRIEIERLALGGSVPVTISCGALRDVPLSTLSANDLWGVIEVADRALYGAKQRGRNQVVLGALPQKVTAWPAPTPTVPTGSQLRATFDDMMQLLGRFNVFATVFALLSIYLFINAWLSQKPENAALGVLVIACAAVALATSRGATYGTREDFVGLVMLDVAIFAFGLSIRVPLTWLAAMLFLLTTVPVALYFRGYFLRFHQLLVALEVVTLFWVGPLGSSQWWPLYAGVAMVVLWVISTTVSEFCFLAVYLVTCTRTAISCDPLTGVLNRRGLERELKTLSCGTQHVAVVDVDAFKLINDNFGHAHGDAVLRVLAQEIKAELAEDGLVARVGGDEFVIICPYDPTVLLRRVSESMPELGFKMSISIGVASITAGESDFWRAAHAADQRLMDSRSSHA